jgi:phosphoglycolate phosphatase-like HAD superfamily hydrolase
VLKAPSLDFAVIVGGCPTVAAAWGYLPDGRRAEELGADWIAADLGAIAQRLGG